MSQYEEHATEIEPDQHGRSSRARPRFRLQFSILVLLIVTAIVAAYFASRDTDLLALNMNGNKILALPIDTYPDESGSWGLLNPGELPLDRVLYRQCKKFGSLSSADRDAVRRSVSDPMEDTLWEFARRSSVFALRDKDPERVRAGLNAMAMLPRQHDFRDVYMTLGLLRRADHELEYDSAMFKEVADICVPGTSRYNMGVMLNEMTVRDPSSTISKNFVETDYGIGYVTSDKGPYDPKGDLLSVAMRVAVAIEETDPNYRANSFKIGQKTKPTYWLRSHGLDSKAIQESLKSAVQFRATIDPKLAKHQRFVVDVYELESPDIVEQLQSVAESQGIVDKTAIFAVSQESIFCIIGTRTYLAGGETHETNESLVRLQTAITRAIQE